MWRYYNTANPRDVDANCTFSIYHHSISLSLRYRRLAWPNRQAHPREVWQLTQLRALSPQKMNMGTHMCDDHRLIRNQCHYVRAYLATLRDETHAVDNSNAQTA